MATYRRAVIAATLAVLLGCASAYPGLAAPAQSKVVSPNYVPVNRLIVPVIHDYIVEGHLILLIVLDVPEEGNREVVRERMTVLRDALLYDLHNYAARHRDILYRVQIEQIKAMFLRTADRVLGPGRVEAVLIQAEARRRL